MKTEDHPLMVAEAGLGADCRVLTGAGGDGASQEGVIAVVVERGDRTCALYCRGSDSTWPSMVEAKNAVEKISAPVVWRETTGGVWVARAGVTEPPVFGRGSGRSRRTEPAETTRASASGGTYMTARVLRGMSRSGLSLDIPEGPRTGSEAERRLIRPS